MLKKLFSNELAKGGLSLFIMFNLLNLLNFIFQISMARLLGPTDLGVLATIMILLYFLAIPTEAIQLLATKYTSRFNGKKEYGKIKYLLAKFFAKGTTISLTIFILAIPIFFILSIILKISFWLFFMMGAVIFSIFLIPSTRGVMQGMKKFHSLGINMVFEGFIRLLVAIIFVLVGWKVYGAVFGIIVGVFAPFLIMPFPLKKVIKSKKETADISKIYSYSAPILYVLLVIMFFQSIDVFIARILFSFGGWEEALVGKYAVANQIGKMIFFGTLAIGKVMFPISAETFERNGKTKQVIVKSFSVVLGICIISLIVIALFPNLIVGLLYGKNYLDISGIIFNMGIAFSLLALSNLVFLYGISINKGVKLKYILAFILFQSVILFVFSSDIYNYSLGMILSGLVLFSISLISIRK